MDRQARLKHLYTGGGDALIAGKTNHEIVCLVFQAIKDGDLELVEFLVPPASRQYMYHTYITTPYAASLRTTGRYIDMMHQTRRSPKQKEILTHIVTHLATYSHVKTMPEAYDFCVNESITTLAGRS